MEFSRNYFTDFIEFSNKKNSTIKRIKSVDLLCGKRQLIGGGTCFWPDFVHWQKFSFFFLVIQKQVRTLPVDHNNNSKMEGKIILLIIFVWNTSINKIQLNISSKKREFTCLDTYK